MTVSEILANLNQTGAIVLGVFLGARGWLTAKEVEVRGRLGQNVAYQYLRQYKKQGLLEARRSRRQHRPTEFQLSETFCRKVTDFAQPRRIGEAAVRSRVNERREGGDDPGP